VLSPPGPEWVKPERPASLPPLGPPSGENSLAPKPSSRLSGEKNESWNSCESLHSAVR